MENNSCGFQISSSREIDIDDDFVGSRSSISSLLSSVGRGGGAEPAGSGGLHPAFFDSIAGYLDSMNHRAPLAEALLRKGGIAPGAPGDDTPQLHIDNIISSTAPLTTNGEAVSMPTVAAGYGGGGVVEQSSEQWQQNTSRGGGGSGRIAAADVAIAATKVGKKRSRASRRAPTTVLTTDTSNFRAMVQEFTGIPPAPFASTSPFSRTRLDFLGPRNLPGVGGTSNPFLLRPYPQRMPTAAQSGGGGGGFGTSTPTPPFFHSLLHPNLLNKTTTTPLTEAQVKAGLLEELGLNPPLLPDLVPSERRSPQWSEGGVACKMSYNKSAAVGGGGDVGRTRTLDLDDSIHNNSADPHHQHSNTANNMRPDRIVDSWISSSDQTLDKLVQ